MADPTTETLPKKLDWTEPPAELTDGTVHLRRWQTNDNDAMYEAAMTTLPELMKWLPWAANGYTREQAADFIAFSRENWGKGIDYDYAVIHNGIPVGSFSLMTRHDYSGIDIGYWMAKAATGQGLATKATALLVKTAFEIGGRDIQIRHDINNARSGAIPKRLGFKCLGEHTALDKKKDTPDVVWQLNRPTE